AFGRSVPSASGSERDHFMVDGRHEDSLCPGHLLALERHGEHGDNPGGTPVSHVAQHDMPATLHPPRHNRAAQGSANFGNCGSGHGLTLEAFTEPFKPGTGAIGKSATRVAE